MENLYFLDKRTDTTYLYEFTHYSKREIHLINAAGYEVIVTEAELAEYFVPVT